MTTIKVSYLSAKIFSKMTEYYLPILNGPLSDQYEGIVIRPRTHMVARKSAPITVPRHVVSNITHSN